MDERTKLVEPPQQSMSAPAWGGLRDWVPEVLAEERCCSKASSCWPRRTDRSTYWDNVKGVLIFLVVFTHTVGRLPIRAISSSVSGQLAARLLEFAMLTTMPGFSFVSGHFSTAKPGRRQLLGNFRLLVTFLIQHLIWLPLTVPRYHALDVAEWLRHRAHELAGNGTAVAEPAPGWLPVGFFRARSIDWFLLCVVAWRAFLPMLAGLRYSVPIVVVASTASLFLDISVVENVQLVFSFLPYFLAGFRFKDMDSCLQRWRRQRWIPWVLAAAVFAGLAVNVFVPTYPVVLRTVGCFHGGLTRDILFSDSRQAGMGVAAAAASGVPPQTGACMSSLGVSRVLGFYALSAACLAGLLAVVPDRPVPVLSKAGENSLYVYLTHYCFSAALEPHMAQLGDDAGIFVALALCVALWALLAWGWIIYICRPCVEPQVEHCGCYDADEEA